MLICHLADSHLGAGATHRRIGSSGLTERQEDMIRAFTEAIDRIIQMKPDLCLHAGDLFHMVRPVNRILAVAAEQLHRLCQVNNIPTVIIAGNHDAPKQPHLGAALEVFSTMDNLHIAASGCYERFRIGSACCHALPHCLTTEIQNAEIARISLDPTAEVNILVAHGVAAGMPEFSMADLGEQELPLELLNRFDYAALGHFHNHRRVSERAWYAGSTERLSQAERESKKGFAWVDTAPWEIGFQEVSSREMVDITHINAAGHRGDQLAQILRQKVAELDSSDKIVRVKVSGVTEETLKTLPSDEIAELRQNAFALDIKFEKVASDSQQPGLGTGALGRIDQGFIQYLQTADLAGFDRERMISLARRYLSEPDENA